MYYSYMFISFFLDSTDTRKLWGRYTSYCQRDVLIENSWNSWNHKLKMLEPSRGPLAVAFGEPVRCMEVYPRPILAHCSVPRFSKSSSDWDRQVLLIKSRNLCERPSLKISALIHNFSISSFLSLQVSEEDLSVFWKQSPLPAPWFP